MLLQNDQYQHLRFKVIKAIQLKVKLINEKVCQVTRYYLQKSIEKIKLEKKIEKIEQNIINLPYL